MRIASWRYDICETIDIMKKLLFILFVLIPYTVVGEVVVPMERQENGLYLIPCKVNGVPMKFIFDTGASSVNISMTEALFLLKNGRIQENDIKGTSRVQIANGEIVENTKILLRKIEVGGIEINDVDATVSHNLNAPLLLGQSAISKLGTIQLEDANLIIKDTEGVEKQNDSKSNVFQVGLIVLFIVVVSYLAHIAFSKFNKHYYTHKTEVLGNSLQKNNSHSRIEYILSWLKCRKYVLYIAYCFMLLLSAMVIELHINNKRENLYSELSRSLQNSFGGIYHSIDGLDFYSIDELEYEEVSIPKLFNNAKRDKRRKKQWNNMFSGIKHVYKITDQAWQMEGMQYTFIGNKDGYLKEGIQDYFFFPYMICVPDGLEFNTQIAKYIIEKSLDKVYCEPDQYNTASELKSTQNEYYHFSGRRLTLEDSVPESCMHFYDGTTGTDPIYDSNIFTGYYWFGMHKIGQYRVIYAYKNDLAWRIEEKDGFSASIKDRVIYHGSTFILLTIILFLILYSLKHLNRERTMI